VLRDYLYSISIISRSYSSLALLRISSSLIRLSRGRVMPSLGSVVTSPTHRATFGMFSKPRCRLWLCRMGQATHGTSLHRSHRTICKTLMAYEWSHLKCLEELSPPAQTWVEGQSCPGCRYLVVAHAALGTTSGSKLGSCSLVTGTKFWRSRGGRGRTLRRSRTGYGSPGKFVCWG
jgi:hypothetical protein